MSSTKQVRLCAGPSKMSVFEKQLSSIHSPSLTFHSEKRKQPTIGYLNYNPVQSGASAYSDDSTLIGNSNSTGSGSPKCKEGDMGRIQVVKGRDSVHFRIPLHFLLLVQRSIYTMLRVCYKTLMSFSKEQINSFLDMMSIMVISTFSAFGVEILNYSKGFFLFTFPISGLCILNFTMKSQEDTFLASSNDFFTNPEELIPDYDHMNKAFQVITGFQFLILCSLVRVASYFKVHHLGKNRSSLDQLTMLVLLLIITGLSVNMVLNTIPTLFKLTKSFNDDSEEQKFKEKQTQLQEILEE